MKFVCNTIYVTCACSFISITVIVVYVHLTMIIRSQRCSKCQIFTDRLLAVGNWSKISHIGNTVFLVTDHITPFHVASYVAFIYYLLPPVPWTAVVFICDLTHKCMSVKNVVNVIMFPCIKGNMVHNLLRTQILLHFGELWNLFNHFVNQMNKDFLKRKQIFSYAFDIYFKIK